MKKIILITGLAVFVINTATAQITQKTVPPVKQNVIIKTVPPPPAPPPPATNKSTGTSNQNTPAPVYSLTAVKAGIRTGNDNKEYPSNVRTSLGVRGSNMQYAFFLQENLKNEMRSNTNTEFGLEKVSKTYSNTTLKDITLEALQNAGFHCRINYLANFQLDAWKIEGVTITLEFRDQNGNLHPSLGNKTITFGNANGFLNGYAGTTTMICNTDGYFNPLSAFIE
jgi:hypothetical protein